jgi:vacuolar-type H+-ATPase catalytic subunit A/Vma1
LKGSPADKSVKFSLFGIAMDTSVVKSDEASVWEDNSSKFEFEIILDSDLGKKPSEIWDSFCDGTVKTVYRLMKTNMEYKQIEERNKIIEQLDKIRDQEKEKEMRDIEGLSRKEINEYYDQKNSFFHMDNKYPNTNYNEIFKKLGELDKFHKTQIKELKRMIYNDSEGIISLAKDKLVKEKTYNGYVFDTIIQIF